MSRNPFDEIAGRYDAWFESENGRRIFAQEVGLPVRSSPGRLGFSE